MKRREDDIISRLRALGRMAGEVDQSIADLGNEAADELTSQEAHSKALHREWQDTFDEMVQSAGKRLDACRAVRDGLAARVVRAEEHTAALLDALRAFCGDYESLPVTDPSLHTAHQHARAAIAKAEGRS